MRYGFLFALLMFANTASARINPLLVGDTIPDIPLKTAEGVDFNLRVAAKEKPLVVIFYRGGWCPYCNRHLEQLQTADPKLRELGYRIVAISPDRPEKLAKTVDKENISYTLLSDSSMEMAKAFGIAFEVDEGTLEKYRGFGIDLEDASGEDHHMLPVPAVYLVGTDGIIDFAHTDPNYRVRLAASVILAAAESAQEQAD